MRAVSTHMNEKKSGTEETVRLLSERHHTFSIAMLTALRPQLRQLLAVDATRWAGIVQLAALFEELSTQVLAHQERDDVDLFPALLHGAVDEQLARVYDAEHRRLFRLLDLLEGLCESTQAPAASAARATVLLRGVTMLCAGVRDHLEAEAACLLSLTHSAQRTRGPERSRVARRR